MRPKFKFDDKVIYKDKKYTINGILEHTILNRHEENEEIRTEAKFRDMKYTEHFISFGVPDFVPYDATEYYEYDIGIRGTTPDGKTYIKTVAEMNLVKEC